MSIQSSMRPGTAPVMTQIAPTASAALAAIRAAEDLTQGQKNKLRSAITGAVAWLRPGEDPKLVAGHVRLDCATLAPLFATPAAQLGMSPDRCTSFFSELRRVLRRFGQHDPDRRGAKLQSAELRALAEAWPPELHHGGVDYLRYLDENGLAPADGGQDTFERYLRDRADRTLQRSPKMRPGQIEKAWNWGQMHVPGWPDIVLIPASKKQPKLDLRVCPASLRLDLERHLARQSTEDAAILGDINPFDWSEDQGRPPRQLSEKTVTNKRNLISGCVRVLLLNGIDPDALQSMADLLLQEHVTVILNHYVRQFKGTDSTMPWKVAQELRLLARDYCSLPAVADKLAKWAKFWKPRRRAGLTPKNKRRLRALTQPLPRAMLLNLPEELMERAQQEPQPSRAATLALYAAMLEILLICPLRQGNVIGLRLDIHLHRPDPRKRRITHLCKTACKTFQILGVNSVQ